MGIETALDEAGAWALLLGLARRAHDGNPIVDGGVRLAGESVVEDATASFVIRSGSERGWSCEGVHGTPALERLFDLFIPLCTGAGSSALAIAHLTQSLDGRIAAVSGTSQFIAGREDLVHTHRLRAISDAVVVGRRTVESDDPQLTTRLCPGPNPVRVVIDPDRRLHADYRVFQDNDARTLLFCHQPGAAHHGRAEVVAIPSASSNLPVAAILAELARRGARRVYVEGGGITVSRFLEARALARLHVTVAPALFGSGRPSFVLPEIRDLSQARALTWRTYAMGADVLFDCTVRA